MKTSQNHTFPMNAQADVSSLHGGSQAGASPGLCVDVCDRDKLMHGHNCESGRWAPD